MKTKTKKYMVFLAILFLPACLINGAYAQSLSGTSASLTPTNMVLDYDLTRVDSNLKPGDSGVLQIVIKNVGLQAAEKVSVYVPGTSNIPVNKRWDVGRVDPLSSKTVSTTIRISSDAYIGLHTLQVRIEFDGYDSEGERDNDQVTVWDYPVRVYGNANFQVRISPGSTFLKDVTETLVITGDTRDGARDVSVTLSSDCADIVGSAKKYIGDLKGGETFRLEYEIQPSEVGVCSLAVLMDYSDVSGNAMQETLDLGIDVTRYDVDFKITDVQYMNATPGTTSRIKIQLENVGSATAEDVSVRLKVSDPFTAIGSSEKYLGKIKADGKEEIEYMIIIDATADIKAYNIPLEMDYYDSAGTKHTIEKSLGVEVSGKPDILLLLEESAIFSSNVKGQITVTVVNKGFAEVKFLKLELLPTEDYSVTSSSVIYVGNLDSDSTDSEEFEIEVGKVAGGTIPLRFEVSYKEKNNNIDHVEPLVIDLPVLSTEEYARKVPAGNPTALLLTVVGGLLGLVVGIIALWFILKLMGAVTGFLDRRLFRRKG